MHCSVVVLACHLAVVLAQAQTPPRVQPSEGSIGAITALNNELNALGLPYSNYLDKLQSDLAIKLIERIHLGNHDLAKLFRQMDETLWTIINNHYLETTWKFEKLYADAFDDIEREFKLVIDRPQERSWLRKLRQERQVTQESVQKSANARRQQWRDVVAGNVNELRELIRRGQCGGHPNAVQPLVLGRLKRVFGELSAIVNLYKQDLNMITIESTRQGFEWTNNIYQSEIAALKHFVT